MNRKIPKGNSPTLSRLVISSFKQATSLHILNVAITTNVVDMEKVGDI
jgi:hypothetical protein